MIPLRLGSEFIKENDKYAKYDQLGLRLINLLRCF